MFRRPLRSWRRPGALVRRGGRGVGCDVVADASQAVAERALRVEIAEPAPEEFSHLHLQPLLQRLPGGHGTGGGAWDGACEQTDARNREERTGGHDRGSRETDAPASLADRARIDGVRRRLSQ